MLKCLALLSLVALAAAASVAPKDDNALWNDEAVQELRAECAKGSDVSCIKLKVVEVMEGILKKDSFKVSESLSVVAAPEGEGDGAPKEEPAAAEAASARGADSDSWAARALRYLRAHELRLRTPAGQVTLSPRRLDAGRLDLSLQFDEDDEDDSGEEGASAARARPSRSPLPRSSSFPTALPADEAASEASSLPRESPFLDAFTSSVLGEERSSSTRSQPQESPLPHSSAFTTSGLGEERSYTTHSQAQESPFPHSSTYPASVLGEESSSNTQSHKEKDILNEYTQFSLKSFPSPDLVADSTRNIRNSHLSSSLPKIALAKEPLFSHLVRKASNLAVVPHLVAESQNSKSKYSFQSPISYYVYDLENVLRDSNTKLHPNSRIIRSADSSEPQDVLGPGIPNVPHKPPKPKPPHVPNPPHVPRPPVPVPHPPPHVPNPPIPHPRSREISQSLTAY